MDASVQRLVDTSHNPLKQPLVESLSQSHAGKLHLDFVLRSNSEFPPSLDFRFEKSFGEVGDRQPQEFADLLSDGVVWEYGLVRAALLLELQVSIVKNGRHDTENSCEFQKVQKFRVQEKGGFQIYVS